MLNIRTWLRYVVNHPRRIVFLTLLVTAIFALQLPNINFKTSVYDLAIENLPDSLYYEKFKKEFGCEEIILVVVKTKGVFKPLVFDKIGQLAEKLSKIEGVKRAISLPEIRKAMDVTKKWGLSDFEKITENILLFKKNLISIDKNTTVISLILDDIDEKDQVVESVQSTIDLESEGFASYQIGMPIVSKALAEFTEQDFKRLPPITFAVIALILFLFFKNLRGILIPTGSVIIALIWTFGLMAWMGIPLSMLTMIVPIFLIAVGTAYCMYIFPEYLASIKTSDSPKEASFLCYSNLAFPTSLAVITTTIALGSLLANKISAIREFAFFSCIGILSMLVVILTFLPAIMALLSLPSERIERASRGKELLDKILGLIVRINLHHQKMSLTIIGILTLIAIAGIYRIKVETNPVDYFKEETSIAQNFHDVYKHVAGSFPINVVIDSGEEDYFEKPENLKQISEIQAFLESLEGVDKTISYLDYLRLVNYATNQYSPEKYALPEESFEVRMLVNSFKSMLGEDMHSRFMNESFSKLNIMLRTHISSSEDFLTLRMRILDGLHQKYPKTLSFNITGFGLVISQSSQLLTEGQVKSLFLTLGLVFLIMLVLFMSWKVGLIGIVTNLFPIAINFGIMGWMGIPLSTATSLIASVAIGLAVDDTIHYLVRFNKEFKKDLDKERTLRDTLQKVGKPILFTTITISLGFSLLMFSSFEPTAIFGLMMVITMFSALIGDLILLPSLMLHVELITIWDLLRLKLGEDPQKGIPLFDGLSGSQVHYILMAGALKKYQQGDVLFRKGEISDSMFAIISGDLEVVDEVVPQIGSEINGGARKLIRRLSTGDVVGEMGMIRSCKRSATVVATGPVELLQINDRMIKRLQWLYPPTAQKFFFNLMSFVCNRLEDTTQCYLEETTIDALTGLHLRSYFENLLEMEISRSVRYKMPLSVFIMDLDNFRGLNKIYGFSGGDHILTGVGEFLTQHARRSDLVCRYDGQQFAVMLPQSDAKEAYTTCDRLRTLLSKHSFEFDSNPIYITASFGISTLDIEKDTKVKEILDQTSKALNNAKSKGKNRVESNR